MRIYKICDNRFNNECIIEECFVIISYTQTRKWNGRTPPSLPWSDNANSQLDTNKYFAIALFCFAIFNIFRLTYIHIRMYLYKFIWKFVSDPKKNWFLFSHFISIYFIDLNLMMIYIVVLMLLKFDQWCLVMQQINEI